MQRTSWELKTFDIEDYDIYDVDSGEYTGINKAYKIEDDEEKYPEPGSFFIGKYEGKDILCYAVDNPNNQGEYVAISYNEPAYMLLKNVKKLKNTVEITNDPREIPKLIINNNELEIDEE